MLGCQWEVWAQAVPWGVRLGTRTCLGWTSLGTLPIRQLSGRLPLPRGLRAALAPALGWCSLGRARVLLGAGLAFLGRRGQMSACFLPLIVRWTLRVWGTSLRMRHMTTGATTALTRWTLVGKAMSLLFNTLSRLVTAFLPRSECLLISWLQSPSAVILEPKKIKSFIVSIVSHLFPTKWWDQMPWS